MIGFLEFRDDEILVALDEIALVRPITEQDVDTRTGTLLRSIPEGAVARIDTKTVGWFYVSEDAKTIMRRLAEAGGALQ